VAQGTHGILRVWEHPQHNLLVGKHHWHWGTRNIFPRAI